jgi:hypothetical protein
VKNPNTLSQLDERERQIMFECLRAAVNGPFFPEWEVHTLFGLERQEVKQVAEMCPNIDDSNEQVNLAIHNSIGNLLGYPHGEENTWQKFISASPEEVEKVFQKWCELNRQIKCQND